MRVKVKAKDLREGQIAFLPYFGKPRKAKIIAVGVLTLKDGKKGVRVDYEIDGMSNECWMSDVERQYEVYRRPAR